MCVCVCVGWGRGAGVCSHSYFSTYNIIYITSRGTRRCPGWPMAKPDSNFVYHITKKGDGIVCGNVSE